MAPILREARRSVAELGVHAVAMRFPREDWYLLPTLETFYYVAGAYLEERA